MLTAATTQEQVPPATVMMPAPPESKPNPQFPTSAQPETPTAPRVDTGSSGGGSRTLLWVAMILGGVILLCGGGFVGLVAVGVITDDGTDGPPERKEQPATPTPSLVGSPNGDPSRKLVKSIDPRDWESNIVEGEFIQADSRSNGLELKSKKGYFYVILTKNEGTYDRSTLLTVKNRTGRRALSGFGLVIHSYADSVLERDYAFVIRSDNGTFRIIRHENKKERDLVKWTKSRAIKRGTADNDLEIRASGDRLRFYINGELVKTLRDYTNYKKGVAGVYTSDTAPIVFRKMEIRE